MGQPQSAFPRPADSDRRKRNREGFSRDSTDLGRTTNRVSNASFEDHIDHQGDGSTRTLAFTFGDGTAHHDSSRSLAPLPVPAPPGQTVYRGAAGRLYRFLNGTPTFPCATDVSPCYEMLTGGKESALGGQVFRLCRVNLSSTGVEETVAATRVARSRLGQNRSTAPNANPLEASPEAEETMKEFDMEFFVRQAAEWKSQGATISGDGDDTLTLGIAGVFGGATRTTRMPIIMTAMEATENDDGEAGSSNPNSFQERAKRGLKRVLKLSVREFTTWAFYNDIPDCTVRVSVLFGAASQLTALGSTQLTKGLEDSGRGAKPSKATASIGKSSRCNRNGGNGESLTNRALRPAEGAEEGPPPFEDEGPAMAGGWSSTVVDRNRRNPQWVAEVVVPPLATREFVEGRVKGGYRMRCTVVGPGTVGGAPPPPPPPPPQASSVARSGRAVEGAPPPPFSNPKLRSPNPPDAAPTPAAAATSSAAPPHNVGTPAEVDAGAEDGAEIEVDPFVDENPNGHPTIGHARGSNSRSLESSERTPKQESALQTPKQEVPAPPPTKPRDPSGMQRASAPPAYMNPRRTKRDSSSAKRGGGVAHKPVTACLASGNGPAAGRAPQPRCPPPPLAPPHAACLPAPSRHATLGPDGKPVPSLAEQAAAAFPSRPLTPPKTNPTRSYNALDMDAMFDFVSGVGANATGRGPSPTSSPISGVDFLSEAIASGDEADTWEMPPAPIHSAVSAQTERAGGSEDGDMTFFTPPLLNHQRQQTDGGIPANSDDGDGDGDDDLFDPKDAVIPMAVTRRLHKPTSKDKK